MKKEDLQKNAILFAVIALAVVVGIIGAQKLS